MTLEVKKYVGNVVEAVQMTKENSEELAAWIEGRIVMHEFTQEVDESHSHTGIETHIYLKKKPTRKGTWDHGRVGDWFVKDESGLVRIFSSTVFPRIFKEMAE